MTVIKYYNQFAVRPSSYVAFQSNIMQMKLIKEIIFVGKATYELKGCAEEGPK